MVTESQLRGVMHIHRPKEFAQFTDGVGQSGESGGSWDRMRRQLRFGEASNNIQQSIQLLPVVGQPNGISDTVFT